MAVDVSLELDLGSALGWYEHGAPCWTDGDGTEVNLVPRIIHELPSAGVGDLWRGIEAEREEHVQAAKEYATQKTGYRFDAYDLTGAAASAWGVLWQIEYDRLEAEAKERRVLGFASVLRPA